MIRNEKLGDMPAIRAVHLAAFPTCEEADIVDQLRDRGNLTVSLVACESDEVVGHIAFSPVSIEHNPHNHRGVGLAPVAVLPTWQARGIGGQLIRHGLDACRRAEFDFAVVVGHAEYYPRFGFQPASTFGLRDEYGAGDCFMAVELGSGSLGDCRGLVQFGDEFKTA